MRVLVVLVVWGTLSELWRVCGVGMLDKSEISCRLSVFISLSGAMETLLLMIMLLSSLTHTFSHGYDPEEDNWTNGRDAAEMKWFEPDLLPTMLKRMERRPDQQQFFGLMGRRSTAKSQITRKRQKFQAFVGLMGKRSVEGG
uniref:Protachykinin-like n=1 Tax=Astyanax mexicanus TaxID=7994 RepID=A0A3B1KIL8_ASTMX